tara:strand:- start:14980 stop:15141 length:162 start_codon:yes stop_codon:yes gene_type:complete
MKKKYCEICKVSFTTMFRIQHKDGKNWVFACKSCLILAKEDNPNYRYGGTWKK